MKTHTTPFTSSDAPVCKIGHFQNALLACFTLPNVTSGSNKPKQESHPDHPGENAMP